jgi:hypothetical protein
MRLSSCIFLRLRQKGRDNQNCEETLGRKACESGRVSKLVNDPPGYGC